MVSWVYGVMGVWCHGCLMRGVWCMVYGVCCFCMFYTCNTLYIYAYTYTIVDRWMPTYIRTCMHAYVRTCMHAYIHTYIHTCTGDTYIHIHAGGGDGGATVTQRRNIIQAKVREEEKDPYSTVCGVWCMGCGVWGVVYGV